MATLQQVFSRGVACARRRGRRSWTATPGRPRRGWIRSSGARGNLWSRGVTAREAYGSRSRRAVPGTETPATTTTTRRRTRRRQRARCSGRCSRRKAAAGGSAGAGGRRRHRRRSRRSARCASRSSVRGTCWRTSPAPTASTGPAPCHGSRPPPAAPSAAPPSTSPPTNRPQRPRVGRVVVLVWRVACTYRYATAECRVQTGSMPVQVAPMAAHGMPCVEVARPPGCRLAVRGVAAHCCCCRVRRPTRWSPASLAREPSVWWWCAERRVFPKAGCCSPDWLHVARVQTTRKLYQSQLKLNRF